LKRAPAHSDRAFVLRTSPYGESDVVVTLLGERDGIVPALARRARSQSPRKNALVLEPFHTLAIELAPGTGELAALRSSVIDIARASLLDDAIRLDVAGLATRWVRTLCPPRTPEPEVFLALETLLDRLAAGTKADAALATFGLQLLDALGYGLELSACARCSKARPAGKSAYVTAVGGGVACEACRTTSTGDALLEGALLDALARDPVAAMDANEEQVARLLRIVRDAIDLRARAVGSRMGAR
jgi:DNA repair protein RecO (recombination protein O)